MAASLAVLRFLTSTSIVVTGAQVGACRASCCLEIWVSIPLAALDRYSSPGTARCQLRDLGQVSSPFWGIIFFLCKERMDVTHLTQGLQGANPQEPGAVLVRSFV